MSLPTRTMSPGSRADTTFFRVRVRDTAVQAISEDLAILVSLDQASAGMHEGEVLQSGLIIFNSDVESGATANRRYFPVPLNKIAEEKAGSKIAANTVALGAVLGLLGYNFQTLQSLLEEFFGKTAAVGNIAAARAGYDYAQGHLEQGFAYRLGGLSSQARMLLTGNDAIALGAAAADCKFMAAYPMTPSTSIMEYLAERADRLGMVVMQPEDEISAVNMIMGASFAGVRSMTATSGSGFCLMVEGLGLAGITETPIVIVNSQRPGPAVGLPTRTEQGDLLFAVHAHHGDFPRAVLAPATVEEAFWMTIKAFNLADQYQIPVIMLNDHYLASSYNSVDPFDLSKVSLDRGLLYDIHRDGVPYRRHKITESGTIAARLSPAIPTRWWSRIRTNTMKPGT